MKLKLIEKKIEKIKKDILKIGEMRPGSLSKRYNVCGKAGCRCKDPKDPQKHGPYVQLNFVHQGKNATKLIREQFVKKIESETTQFKKFKALSNQLIALEIERSDLQMTAEIEKKDKS